MSERRVLIPLIAVIVVAAIAAAYTLPLLIAVVAIVLLAAVAVLSFIYLPLILPKSTSLTISPSTFDLASGENIALTATPKSGGLTLTGTSTTWVASTGSFDRTSGSVVIYSVPEESESTEVSITASFPGLRPYRPSKATIAGKVVPKRAAETALGVSPAAFEVDGSKMSAEGPFPTSDFSYKMQFGKLALTNAELRAPIAMSGVNVVEITGSLADVTTLALNPLGLNASGATFENIRMYVTRIRAASPELGKVLELTGDQDTKMSMGALTMENGTASVVYLTSARVGLTKPELKGRHSGGDEPYTPVVATAQKVTLDQGYSVQGPTTYEELVNRANNLMAGKIAASDFTFSLPSKYSLDREAKEHHAETKWTMSASSLSGKNPSILFIYFATNYGGFALKGTGEQSPSTIIPHGFSAGWKSPPLPNAQVHAVHFSADELVLKDLVIQVVP
jgi:hypothetical protein